MVKTRRVSLELCVSLCCEWYLMTYDDFRYNAAEHFADRALVLDPCFTKARYRRGLARKGNLELARAAVGMCLP